MERRALARGDSGEYDREAALAGLNNFVADYHNEMVTRPDEAKKKAMDKRRNGLVNSNAEIADKKKKKKGGKKGGKVYARCYGRACMCMNVPPVKSASPIRKDSH